MKKILAPALAVMTMLLGLPALGTVSSCESTYVRHETAGLNCQIAMRGYLPAILVDALRNGHNLSIIPKAATNAFPLEICPPVTMNRATKNSYKGMDLQNMTKCVYNSRSHKLTLQCKDKYGSAYDFYVASLGGLEALQTKVAITCRTAQDISREFSGSGLVLLDFSENCGIFGLAFPFSRVDGKDDLVFNGTVNGVKIKAKIDRNMLCTVTMKTKLPLYEVALKESRERDQSYRFLTLSQGFGVLYAEPTGTNTYRMQARAYPGSHLDVIYLPDGTTTTNTLVERLEIDDNGYALAYFGSFRLTLEQREGGVAQMAPVGSDTYELSAVADNLHCCAGFEDSRGRKHMGNPVEIAIEGNTTVWPIFLRED